MPRHFSHFNRLRSSAASVAHTHPTLLLLDHIYSPISTGQVECGICYTYDLDGVIPERVCEDQRCARAFHAGCLYEYVRGLPNVRQSFGTFFGACPYCNTPLTVKLPP
jgi:hypothetical protein